MMDNKTATLVAFASIGIITVFIVVMGLINSFVSKTPSYDYQRDMVVVEAEGSNLVLQDINGEV